MRKRLFLSAVLLPAILLTSQAAISAERTITDDTDRTITIPATPERVVVLHEPLIGVPLADLGLAPIGSYGRDSDGKSLMSVDFYREVLGEAAPTPHGIGNFGNMDIEKLRALKPDLIIGTEHDLDKTKQLSTIAPVYLQNSSTGLSTGFDAEAALSSVINRDGAFNNRKNTYTEHLERVQKALPFNAKDKTYLAIFLTDQINAVGDMSGISQAFKDLGFSRLEIQQKSGISGLGSTLLVPLSPEVFGRLNPDLLIVMNNYIGADRDEAGTQRSLDRIVPGWDRFLKPAREGRMLFMDSAKVTTPSIASAIHTLDAINAWISTQ